LNVSPPIQDVPVKQSQFRLVKFFAYASFFILILFSFPFSVIIAQKAKDILMKSYENYALLLGENLNHQVFQNFVIPVSSRFGVIRLRDPGQSELMDRIVKNTIHSFKIDLVNIYDIRKGVIAYSTDPRLVGKKVQKTMGYYKAVKGEHSSGLISVGKDFLGLGIEMGGERKLRTYIPFRGEVFYAEKPALILGVFEVIQDLTEEYRSIARFQYTILGLSAGIMALIFFALLFIVHKAEKIIDERARQQRELEEQLNQAERLAALGQMVAGVSHEIRNPLGIIRSTAELLGEMPHADASQKRLSTVITEESSRLNNIVTEFLDFARPRKPVLKECLLEEIILRNLSFLEPELKRTGITVHDNIRGRSFKIMADPDMLYRAFLNIFMNALQSMDLGGSLNVRIGEEKAHFFAEIEDTGRGIPEEHIKNIFNPFFTTKDRGSGLGLSIVRKIIEGHEGEIMIKSNAGMGTTVIIKLPRALPALPGKAKRS
jgi:two-component system, NtrC family, sensor histidine kinase HydH